MNGATVIQLQRPKDERGRVPYKALNAAARRVADAFPDASMVRPVWAPASERGDILVEITLHGQTRVILP